MNFPRFWAKGTARQLNSRGKPVTFSTWRWSDNSLSEAQSLADQAARRIAERFVKDGKLPSRGYGYLNRPFREPVLRESRNGFGEPSFVITRNSYGATVLNTARIMFLDVDADDQGGRASPRAVGFLSRLFGAKPEPKPAGPSPVEQRNLDSLKRWLNQHPDWNCRLYRTRAGFRILATHELYDPESATSNGIFAALGVDPLYQQLCKLQKCFRARLTPKPWRCRASLPPSQWPWADAKAEAKFRDWQNRYTELCRPWATCALIGTFGSGNVHSEIQPVIAQHDEATRANSNLPLA